MTGISDIPERAGSVQKQVYSGAEKKEESGNNLFKTTFEGILSGTSETTEQISKISDLGEISVVSFNNVISDETKLDQQTDQLLSKLEAYGEKLGNPDISLRDIEPIISEIKETASGLSNNAANSIDNSFLKQIAEEAALSANNEYFKFMRGDYL